MAITILELLQDQTPCGNKIKIRNESLKAIYSLITRHMAEIEEARERGYSWKQIDEACREAWQDSGDSAKGIFWWSGGLIESCYRTLKRHSALKQKEKGKKKPLSLEVTVTER